MTRVFKTRHFQRWMRKTELTSAALCKAVEEMAAGLIDADLGGGVVKAADLLTWTAAQLDEAAADGALLEITDDCQDQTQEPHHGSRACRRP